MSRYPTWIRTLTALSLFSCSTLAVADDWPQWRGPNRDGMWRETGIVEKFAGDELPIKWRVPIGSGYCGPTVAGNRVYVMDRVTSPEQQERIHCFDAATGKPVWSRAYERIYRGIQYPAGPRASVTVHEDRAYSLGSMGDLFCFDAVTGEVLWKKDLYDEYKIRMQAWGISAAPLIEGDLVILHIGGDGACIVALDRKTGEERWKALDDRSSYSAPIVIEQAGERVVVCWTGDSVSALDPKSGKVLWSEPFRPSRMVIGIATPVVENNRLFVTSFYDGSLMLELATDSLAAKQLWRRAGPDEQHTDALHSIIATPVMQGDYVYGIDSYGELRCLDAKTGDRVWEDRTATPRARWSNIHTVKNGDRYFMFNERGELLIAKLSPEGFQEIDRAKLLEPTTDQLRQRGGVCWSHPAFAHQHVFARNDKELVCASLAAE
ncbi:MAG: PQQ-like beta-propeller repeat protein [Planctomycetia bacterium]|nr:PQQ-like beta-propeller repeat protein [Planctomycetia bacterium]